MKRIVLMTLLALALPVAAFGNEVLFLPEQTGTLTGSSSGLTLTGSMEISVILGLGGKNYVGGGLGTITLTTGPLISGNLTTGGLFGPGGSIVITANGSDGGPKGVLFIGTFSSAPFTTSWGESGGYYYLTGSIRGIWYSGGLPFAASGGITLGRWVSNGGNGFTRGLTGNGAVNISPGSTVLPEPGTLGLLGTGLAGLAGVMRRKLRV